MEMTNKHRRLPSEFKSWWHFCRHLDKTQPGWRESGRDRVVKYKSGEDYTFITTVGELKIRAFEELDARIPREAEDLITSVTELVANLVQDISAIRRFAEMSKDITKI